MRFGSLETRWFFAGPLPAAAHPVVEWFLAARPFAVQGGVAPPTWPGPWRHDLYWVLAGQDDMGVKWRREPGAASGGERLEFKGRIDGPGPVTLGDGVRGRLERWIKWSYPAAAAPEGLLRPFTSGDGSGGVPVRKKRLLRMVRLDDDGAAVEVTAGGALAASARAVHFELTRGEAGHEPFWTLAVEAFPGEAWARKPFTRVAARLLEGWPGPPLAPTNSLSYPAWLQRLP